MLCMRACEYAHVYVHVWIEKKKNTQVEWRSPSHCVDRRMVAPTYRDDDLSAQLAV